MADGEPNVEEEMISVAEEDEEDEDEEETFPVESLRKMKVAELRKLLKDRGLPSMGSKAELLSRLQKALSPDADTGEEAEVIEDEDDDVEEDTSDAENAITEEEDDVKVVEEVNVPEKTEVVVKKPASPAKVENSEEPKEKESLTTVAIEEPTVTTEKSIPAITAPSSDTPTSETTDKTDAAAAKPLVSSDEKLRQRAERFGIASDTDKKAARAARFGTVTTNLSNKPSAKIAPTPVTVEDIDRLKKRAERFGTVVSSTLSKLEDEDKLLKRKQRFGQITGPASNNSTTKSTTPPVKINTEEVEEKKRKRAERFGLS